MNVKKYKPKEEWLKDLFRRFPGGKKIFNKHVFFNATSIILKKCKLKQYATIFSTKVGRQEDVKIKEHKGAQRTFGDDVYIHYVDCGDVSSGYTCQNLPYCTL